MTDRIKKSVGKHQRVHRLAKSHEKDLRYTALVVRNYIIRLLRKSCTPRLPIIDKVLEVSNVIEETTLMRMKVGRLESYYKKTLVESYLEEGADYSFFCIGCRIKKITSRHSEGKLIMLKTQQ